MSRVAEHLAPERMVGEQRLGEQRRGRGRRACRRRMRDLFEDHLALGLDLVGRGTPARHSTSARMSSAERRAASPGSRA